MRIQLRQTEIEEALQQYIVNQGINLTGKVVEIGFTSSRSEAGLTADVDITNAPDDGKTPAQAIPRAAVKAEAPVIEQPAEEAIAQEEQAPEAQAEEAPVKEPATLASSLFS